MSGAYPANGYGLADVCGNVWEWTADDFPHEPVHGACCAPAPAEEAIKPLRFLGNDMMVFHVLDRAELEFNYDDASSFEDLESGEQMPVVPDALREQYRKLIREHINALTTKASEQRVDYTMLSTTVPLDYALFNYMSIRDRLTRTR